MRKTLLAAALAAACVPPASAAEHFLTARITRGNAAYSQTVRSRVGAQQNFVGTVRPEFRGEPQQMIFNVLLSPGAAQYQIELSPGRGVEGRSIQAQGELKMRPGDAMTAVQCGPWTIEFGLDAKPKKRTSKKKGPPDPALSRGNVRVTAKLAGRGGKTACSQTLAPNSQGNVVDGILKGGRKLGSIMNLLAKPAGGGAVDVQYQLEFTPSPSPKASVQAQSEVRLPFGKTKTSSLPGYELSWLAQGAPAPKEEKGSEPAKARKPAQKPQGGPVPLLR